MSIKKISLGIFMGIAVVLTSCENPTDVVNAEIVIEENDNHDHAVIELDNGKKWKVVDEMMASIRLMENEVNDFNDPENQKYEILAANLQANVNLLTSNCTMTGKAHDELHKWLLPYIDLVDELANSEDEDAAKRTYASLRSSFKTFNTFFE